MWTWKIHEYFGVLFKKGEEIKLLAIFKDKNSVHFEKHERRCYLLLMFRGTKGV